MQRTGHEVDRGDKPLAARLPSRVSPCVAAARRNRNDDKDVLFVADAAHRGAESFAELGSLSWLNALISWLWPSFNRPEMLILLQGLLMSFRCVQGSNGFRA